MYKRHHNQGITLIELMIVMTVIAIIGMIALPSYQLQMTKTRRADGQAELMEIMNAEERYYTINNTYTMDLQNDLNYPVDGSGNVISSEGYYKVSAAACGSITSCVILTASSQGAQSGDGNLTLNSLGVKAPADKW